MGNTSSRDSYSDCVSTDEWHRRRAGREGPAPSSWAYRERTLRIGTRDGSSSDMSSDTSSSLYSRSESDHDYMFFARRTRPDHSHYHARRPSPSNRLYIVQEVEELDKRHECPGSGAGDEYLNRADCNSFRPRRTGSTHENSGSDCQPRSASTHRPGDTYLDRPDSTGFRPRRIFNPHEDLAYDFRPGSSSVPRMPVQHVSPTYSPCTSSPVPDPHPGQRWVPPTPQPHPHPPPSYDESLGAFVEHREPRFGK